MDSDEDDRDGDGPGRGGGFGRGPHDRIGEPTGGKKEPSKPYTVGYGKPPPEHRIKPGQCLNRTGRPKGSKNKPKDPPGTLIRRMILNESRRQIPVREADGTVLTLSMAQANYRSLGIKGLKGNARASRDYLLLAQEAERQEASERASLFGALGEYAGQYERIRQQQARLGKKPPDYLPVPESIIVGPEGVLGFRDAVTEEDKARWEKHRTEWRKELKVLEDQHKVAKWRKRARIENEMATLERLLVIVNDALAGSRPAMWILDQGTGVDDENQTT